MNTYYAYLIETLTNTHVGIGAEQVGIVDNLIQRDPVTRIPVFYSSSLKGALRDHLTTRKNGAITDNLISGIFGKEYDQAAKTKDERKTSPGNVIFFEARLLTLPLRSTRKVFYHCTCRAVLKDYCSALLQFFPGEKSDLEEIIKWLNNLSEIKNFIVFDDADIQKLEIEDYQHQADEVKTLSKELSKIFDRFLKVPQSNLALFNDDIFRSICDNGMPVIARNKLDEKGESENLFYDEILPRRSVLWFVLGLMDKIYQYDYEKFEATILDTNIVQFGGNYTIGYGFSKIERLTPQRAQEETHES